MSYPLGRLSPRRFVHLIHLVFILSIIYRYVHLAGSSAFYSVGLAYTVSPPLEASLVGGNVFSRFSFWRVPATFDSCS